MTDFELQICGAEPPAPVRRFVLREREQHPPRLDVVLAPVPRGEELAGWVDDGPVSLTLDGELAFAGQVTEVRRVRGEVRLTVSPPTASDLRLTRTFAPPAADPVPLFELTGFRAAFPAVEHLEQLAAAAHHFTQDSETGPQLLRRAARLSGRVLAFTHDTVRVARPPSGTGRPIRPAGAGRRPGADCWVVRRRPAGAETPEGLNRRYVGWETLTDLGVRVGEVVTLPPGSAYPGPLRVARRVVRFDAACPDAGLTTRLQLRPTGGVPLVRGGGTVRVVGGEVMHVTDARRLGRVGVRFPWMASGCVMAEVAQPSTAAFAVPRVGDRVAVLLRPRSVAPPLLLGATFTPGRPAATAAGDALVEWRTPEGLLVRLDRAAGQIVLAVFDAAGVTEAELTVSAAGLRLTGDVEFLRGNVRFS